MTHGCRNQRKPGSIGQCAYPARVRKGLHMYGHMGDERVTVKNLKLVRVDAEQNLRTPWSRSAWPRGPRE